MLMPLCFELLNLADLFGCLAADVGRRKQSLTMRIMENLLMLCGFASHAISNVTKR